MSLSVFLMAMQAAGAVMDTWGTSQQMALGQMGTQVELEQLETRLQEEQTAAALGSLQAMQRLRQVIASQNAIFAARGQKAGAGTAFFLGQESLRQHAMDERIRRMNLLSREAQLRAGGALTGMHQLKSETELGQALSRRLYETLPLSQAAQGYERRFGQSREGFGMESL